MPVVPQPARLTRLRFTVAADKDTIIGLASKIVEMKKADYIKIHVKIDNEPARMEVSVEGKPKQLIEFIDALPPLRVGVNAEQRVFIDEIEVNTGKRENVSSFAEAKEKIHELLRETRM